MTVTPPRTAVKWGMIIGAVAMIVGAAALILSALVLWMLTDQQSAFWLLIFVLGVGLFVMSFLSWGFEALEEIAVQQLEIRRQKK